MQAILPGERKHDDCECVIYRYLFVAMCYVMTFHKILTICGAAETLRKVSKSHHQLIQTCSQNLSITDNSAALMVFAPQSLLLRYISGVSQLSVTSQSRSGAMCTHVRSLGKTEGGCQCCSPPPSPQVAPPHLSGPPVLVPGPSGELTRLPTATSDRGYRMGSRNVEYFTRVVLLSKCYQKTE